MGVSVSGELTVFDRPEMKYVSAKMFLAGHLDRLTTKNLF